MQIDIAFEWLWMALSGLLVILGLFLYSALRRERSRGLQQVEESLKLKNNLLATESELKFMKESGEELKRASSQKEQEFKETTVVLMEEKNELLKKYSALKEFEEIRKREHQRSLEKLNGSMDRFELEIQRKVEQEKKEQEQRFLLLQESWKRHEAQVEEQIKLICQKHALEYVSPESYPYKGKPDNAVKVADQFVIFDSKSPQGEDLGHFKKYIKDQASKLVKYQKHEEVQNDAFLVVPTNAVEVVESTYIESGKFRVYVVTLDALEPILVGLKRIENYEFAENLSPEDKERVASLIGKMSYGMKRKIREDYFYSKEFLNILSDVDYLPAEIKERVEKIEKASVLNSPRDLKGKMDKTAELVKDVDKSQIAFENI